MKRRKMVQVQASSHGAPIHKRHTAHNGARRAGLPMAMDATDPQSQLAVAVNTMAEAQPPIAFAQKFLFTEEFLAAGQSVVFFARGNGAGRTEYAIKYVSPCMSCLEELCYDASRISVLITESQCLHRVTGGQACKHFHVPNPDILIGYALAGFPFTASFVKLDLVN
jgi:hypothetical protein